MLCKDKKCDQRQERVRRIFVLATGKKALYLSVNVFGMKVLIEDAIFKSPTGDRTAILRGHLSHAKV